VARRIPATCHVTVRRCVRMAGICVSVARRIRVAGIRVSMARGIRMAGRVCMARRVRVPGVRIPMACRIRMAGRVRMAGIRIPMTRRIRMAGRRMAAGRAMTLCGAMRGRGRVRWSTRMLSRRTGVRSGRAADPMPAREPRTIAEAPAISVASFQFSNCDSLRPPDLLTIYLRLFPATTHVAQYGVGPGRCPP
jgi:hypothetical protein